MSARFKVWWNVMMDMKMNDAGREVSARAGRRRVAMAAWIATQGWLRWWLACWLALLSLTSLPVQAEESTCARVKIQVKQRLALERQAFEAEMQINNTTDTSVLENLAIDVKVMDESGVPVAITDDPNNLAAKFYVRVSSKQGIDAIDGSGVVNPQTTGIVDWLLIPAPGAAGTSPLGKKYLIGATLRYRNGGQDTVLEVAPDVIVVKPMPLLTMDYFLPQNVWADDPMTPEIEPVEPFTLGVRIRNTGLATAKGLKIDSAQPKIEELGNAQGLLINFKIDGAYLNDAPAQNTLLLNFGDIAAGASKTGRWIMETTLAGRFTAFTAKFSHANELGGTLTSLLQATNAHLMLRDVRVDLPGRDLVRDFLAQDGDVLRVYESDAPDSLVTDRSGVATLTAGVNAAGNASYRLTIPATEGFVYVRLPDPSAGRLALGQIVRADAKAMLPENVWLSKTRNEQTKALEYWINLFDVNTPGAYDAEFQAPPAAARPPAVQFVPDRTVTEEQQVSFVVEASSPDGRPVSLSAAPLPAGARFTMQAPDPQAPGLTRALFDWTPAKGTAGSYLLSYTANDGLLSTTTSATIKVQSYAPPPGPGTPTIASPLVAAQVTTLRPMLAVQTSTNTLDPTIKVQFEVYADEAMSQLVATGFADKAPALPGNDGGSIAQPTSWQPTADLQDNTWYWWRARASDGSLNSAWANGRFFVNLFNDPPDSFNLTNPVPNVEVATLQPVLAWTNSHDKDGDAITYQVQVYSDAALQTLATQSPDLPEDASGSTGWTVGMPLSNHVTYHWRVAAKDALGAQMPTAARWFLVNTGNAAPTDPVLLSPAVGGQSTSVNTALTIQNSTDADNDLLTYVFEIDTVNTFDSGDKRTSGQVIQSATGSTSWAVTGLVENKRYWWRVKAQDGRAESAWVVGDFLMNAANEAPPTPTVKNPGNGAWSATQQPTLEANPVIDPEGDPVQYRFEVFRDAALSLKVADGVSTNTSWVASPPLDDRTTYWWHVQAVDPQGAASGWTGPAVLYVSTGPYQDPTIAVTSPVTPVSPDIVATPAGTLKQVTIRWEGVDPNIEPTIALYYGTTNSGYAGNLIVDGLRQSAGAQTGSYVWDVSSLAPGVYYIYAVIYDAKGVGKAYAPGAVVVPNSPQTGGIDVLYNTVTYTNENGGWDRFHIKLTSQPSADVVIPLSSSNPNVGTVAQTSLTFTRQNWWVYQGVIVTGKDDCFNTGDTYYQVVPGKAQTLDPNYVGLVGTPVTVVNYANDDTHSSTNQPNILVCGMKVVSSSSGGLFGPWTYTLQVQMTNNNSAPIGGAAATLVQQPSGVTILDGQAAFGAIGSGETGTSSDTISVRSTWPIGANTFRSGSGFIWSVGVQP